MYSLSADIRSAILNKIGNKSSYRGRVAIGVIVTILPFVLCCALPAGALIFGYSELREPDEFTKVFEQAEAYALAGDTERASTAFAQAAQPAIETDDHIRNNKVCWFASIDGFAEIVLPACERAVELAPENGGVRDSRGLARALTGNYAGAIEDFKAYVEWSKANCRYEPLGTKREGWIADLETGRNPFDEATLEELRSEQAAPCDGQSNRVVDGKWLF